MGSRALLGKLLDREQAQKRVQLNRPVGGVREIPPVAEIPMLARRNESDLCPVSYAWQETRWCCSPQVGRWRRPARCQLTLSPVPRPPAAASGRRVYGSACQWTVDAESGADRSRSTASHWSALVARSQTGRRRRNRFKV